MDTVFIVISTILLIAIFSGTLLSLGVFDDRKRSYQISGLIICVVSFVLLSILEIVRIITN